jgi:hypothetical protein
MTRDEIIKMAMRAYGDWFPNVPIPNELERFAAKAYEAGAAAEREAACRIVTGLCISDNNSREICEAIRARSKT